MNNDIKWKEIPRPKIRAFQLGDEPEVIYVITIRDNEYMVIHEDAYGISTGEIEFLYRKELQEKYEIDLTIKTEIRSNIIKNTLSFAVEYGYKQCEKGNNIQAALKNFVSENKIEKS